MYVICLTDPALSMRRNFLLSSWRLFLRKLDRNRSQLVGNSATGAGLSSTMVHLYPIAVANVGKQSSVEDPWGIDLRSKVCHFKLLM